MPTSRVICCLSALISLPIFAAPSMLQAAEMASTSPASISPASASPASATTPAVLRPVEFVLQAPDGQPLRGQGKLHVFDDRAEVAKSADSLSWQDGVARVPLPMGRYDVWIEPNGEVCGKIFRRLDVAAGAQAQRIELKLPPVASVRGRLLLADGHPATGYQVAVQSGSRPLEGGASNSAAYARGARDAYARTLVGADGTWTLSGLAPALYALDVFAPGQSAPLFTLPAITAVSAEIRDIGSSSVPQNGWEWLFDRQLKHSGAPSKFEGQGDLKTDGERLSLGVGTDLTGVTWTENLPLLNYEISLDARRTAGNDFFCGLTFPVGDAPLSLIVGGWGGRVTGLSSINGMSAEENETSKIRSYENDRWYRVRLRVTKAKIEAWIDDEPMVNFITEGKRLSIRFSVEPSKPLGIATWRTAGWLRDIRLRRLDANEVAAIEKAAAEPAF